MAFCLGVLSDPMDILFFRQPFHLGSGTSQELNIQYYFNFGMFTFVNNNLTAHKPGGAFCGTDED